MENIPFLMGKLTIFVFSSWNMSLSVGTLQKSFMFFLQGRCWTLCWMTQPGNLPYTLWLFNIAMENGSFIDGLPIKNGDFPWLC